MKKSMTNMGRAETMGVTTTTLPLSRARNKDSWAKMVETPTHPKRPRLRLGSKAIFLSPSHTQAAAMRTVDVEAMTNIARVL